MNGGCRRPTPSTCFPAPVVSHLARARLFYGEWLRRNNRRTDTATQLRRAFDEFAALGANAFARRTRCELEATGEKVRAHREDPGAGLTPQERPAGADPADQPRGRRRSVPERRTVEWQRLREGHFSFRDRGPSGTLLYVVTVAISHGVRAKTALPLNASLLICGRCPGSGGLHRAGSTVSAWP